MSRFFFLILGPGLFFAGCNSDKKETAPTQKTEGPGFDKTQAQSFVDSINRKFSEQVAAGDSSALASHYWPDAELLLDNSEPVKGDKIIGAWGSLSRMGVKELNLTTTDIKTSQDFIIETGSYIMKAGDNLVLDKGKYVVVWEKRNGEWKLYRDIASTSMPPAK